LSITELVALLGVLVAMCSSVGVPVYLNRKKDNAQAEAANLQSWQGLTAAMQAERDGALRRLREMEAEYADKFHKLEAGYVEKFHKLEADCNRRVDAANSRVQQLEAEVTGLYRRIHGS
jgi:Tfp pilus assembly protein PilV